MKSKLRKSTIPFIDMKKPLLFALFLCWFGLSAFAQQYHMIIRTSKGVVSYPVDEVIDVQIAADDTPGTVLCYTIEAEDTTLNAVRMRVNYRSLSGDSKSLQTVSGFVSYPLYSKPGGILLDNHYTMTQDITTPSIRMNTDVSEAMAGVVASMYAVVAPDYVGYGVTRDQPHPYLCQRQNAINSIDLALVARDIFTSRGIEFTSDALVNAGYSQGGGIALAVHREMELDPALAEQLHFRHTFCGGGPYDTVGTMEWMLGEAADKLELPVLLPLIVRGLLYGMPDYFHGRTFADFFRPEIVEAGVEDWIEGHEMSTTDISNAMRDLMGGSHNVADYFSPEVLDETSPIRRELEAAIEACTVLDGWKATLPITLYHLQNDGVVPVLNYHRAIESLGLDANKQTLSTSTTDSHFSYGTQFYLALVFSMANLVR